MVGALWTGISGLAGSQTALDNESNNIANVNTIGYKASRISFADQMYQDKIGKGVTSFDIEKMYTQGNLKNTGVSYDMALSSDGFFTVSNGSETFYTRAGNFRMGESGNLEDVGQNNVQGWAMSPITDDDRISTDINATYFTNEFSKTLGNKIIRDSSTIETIVAKATDFTTTAASDVETVFRGFGAKTASAKKADIDALITEYNSLLTTHAKADPKPTAASSSVQKNYLNFNLDTVKIEEGDEIYLYIDGDRYAEKFDTDEATTLKKFADQIANLKGFDAHYTNGMEDNASGTIGESAYEFDNVSGNDPKGGLYIESLIPGLQFRITEFGSVDTSNDNQTTKGEVKTIQAAVQGTGMGAIESVEEALAKAVSGKQQDVYSTDELMLSSTQVDNQFTYQINIYDKDTKSVENVPSVPLVLSNPVGAAGGVASVDDIVNAINTVANADGTASKGELAYYVKAFNVNGNLVVQTLDKNFDVEFTGELKGPIPEQQLIKLTGNVDLAEHQTVGITGTTTALATFAGNAISGAVIGDTGEETIDKIIADKDALISAWNADPANVNDQLSNILKNDAGELEYVYEYQAAAPTITPAVAGTGLTISATTVTQAHTDQSSGSTVGAGTTAFRFLDVEVTGVNHGDSTSATIEKIVADKNDIIAAWNAANPTAEIDDILKVSSDELKIVYKNTQGDTPSIAAASGYLDSSYGMQFDDADELVKGSFNGLITRNNDYSGREGAGAEFLKITTTINQTASQDSIQLRLDSLGLTDSAFGDFSVDSTGLVTMQQDGVDFAVGQVSIAKFTDNRGLEAIGGNLLKATTRSGTALYNIDNDKTAEVNGGQLELSTADLSESLVNLMVFQRAFEANAKSITTADSILTTLIQLKR